MSNFKRVFCLPADNSAPRAATYDPEGVRQVGEDEGPPTGCWYYFHKCLGGIWATREMNLDDDKEVYVRTTIRELVIYSIFVLTLSISKQNLTTLL